MADFKPAALTNIAAAAALAGRCPPDVLAVLETELLRRGRTFEPRALATAAKAFAEARADYPRALETLGRLVSAKV